MTYKFCIKDMTKCIITRKINVNEISTKCYVYNSMKFNYSIQVPQGMCVIM